MDAHSLIGAGSASLSPTSPVSARHGPMIKRKRSMGGLDSDQGSELGDLEDQSLLEREKKRQPGVKRACNECRQQKVSQPNPKWPDAYKRAPWHHIPRRACAMRVHCRLTVRLCHDSYAAMWCKTHSRVAPAAID